jgi:hypothetical protein
MANENLNQKKNMSNEFPRRSKLQEMVSAEKMIFEAIQEIEKMGADVLLSDAQLLLQQAKDKVSDFVDASHA